MPDLSHRPTRYATAAFVASAFLAGAWPAVGQLLNAADQLSATKAQNAQLNAELEKAHSRNVVPGAAPTATRISAAANCSTYPDQETAQRAFVAHPAALRALDGDGDGNVCEQLKSARTVVLRVGGEPMAPRSAPERLRHLAKPVWVPTKAALVASGHHFGIAAGTHEEVGQLDAALGRNATMVGYFSGWDSGYQPTRVRAAWQRGEVPVMTWESRALENGSDTTDYGLPRIINGSFDDYLTTYAKQVAAAKMPLVIRFDHEMNGNWYRWGEFQNQYGVKVGDYVKAWRHVHDVFQKNGANAYVVWLWSPNRIDNLAHYPAIDGYYPGDTYVDWVGMTAYYRPGDPVATFDATVDLTLAALRRVAPHKPIFLSEVGATEDGGHKLAWVQTLWSGLAAKPDVVGLMWFNYAISAYGHTNDWRMNSSGSVFNAFKAGLLAHTYGRPIGKRPVLYPRLGPAPYPVIAPAGAGPTPVPSPAGLPLQAPAAAPAPAAPAPAPAAPTTAPTAAALPVAPAHGNKHKNALSSAIGA